MPNNRYKMPNFFIYSLFPTIYALRAQQINQPEVLESLSSKETTDQKASKMSSSSSSISVSVQQQQQQMMVHNNCNDDANSVNANFSAVLGTGGGEGAWAQLWVSFFGTSLFCQS
ncbi:hypothetical protein niasHT_023434 [Heterodera trifolii]|uniref:Uncharacterized protein n=1 Tax=Heterodera trifolii TaxID=157864 RepID=A0ABD2K419_9BILA